MDNEQLQIDRINRANMTSVAYERAIKPTIESHRVNLYRTLINYYRSGEHGSKLFAVLGELAGLENLEQICQQTIKQGNVLETKMKEARNVSERRDY
jgi:hypothetical protein